MVCDTALDNSDYSYVIYVIRRCVLAISFHIGPEAWNNSHVWTKTETFLCSTEGGGQVETVWLASPPF